MPAFTDNDIRLMDKTLSIRERLIDNILSKQELPTAPKDLEAFTNLLNSVDNSILGRAKIKIEDTNAKANEETKDMLRDLLLNLHKNSSSSATNLGPTELKESQEFKSLNIDVHEGELIRKADEIDIKTILANN